MSDLKGGFIMCDNVWKNLGEEKATELYNEYRANGYSEDDAFTEVYSIECNLDEDARED